MGGHGLHSSGQGTLGVGYPPHQPTARDSVLAIVGCVSGYGPGYGRLGRLCPTSGTPGDESLYKKEVYRNDVLMVEISQQLHLSQSSKTKHGVVERGNLFDGDFLA